MPGNGVPGSHTDPSLPLPPVRKELQAEATVSGSPEAPETNPVKASRWQHDTQGAAWGGRGSWEPLECPLGLSSVFGLIGAQPWAVSIWCWRDAERTSGWIEVISGLRTLGIPVV